MVSLQAFQIPDLLRETQSPWGDGVVIDVEDLPQVSQSNGSADFLVNITWGRQTLRFVAKAKTRSVPRVLQLAVEQAKAYANASELLPMVVVPYLAERQARMLIEQGVSGLDLSGNGVIVAPGKMLLCRTGCPNRYPESQPMRYAYRGSTSVVPRVFLALPEYTSVKEIREEIKIRGVDVAPSTVSKALARMEEDILILRVDDRIKLVQPDELLDRLASSYRRPRTMRTVELRTDLSIQDVFNRLSEEMRCTLTGASSMAEYAVGARGDTTAVYCESLPKLKGMIGEAWNETTRFADLKVIETRDKELYFDTRRNGDGVTVASPVQAYIELNSGDKRDKQMADHVRTRLLATLGNTGRRV